MGMREWHWGSGKSSRRGRSGGGGPREKAITTSTGCMCAVFQLFDFHQLQLANLHHHNQQPSFHPEDLPVPKGVEAPRNSLDSSEGTSLSCTTKEEENLNSPIMKIQIKTSGGNTTSSDMNSPGTKTPSLVARLMGLDLLPDQTPSPSSSTISSNSNSHPRQRRQQRQREPLQSRPRKHVVDMSDNNTANGTRSLPETPRVSSARRSDVDHHHRLSLQINKENVGVGEELDFSRASSFKRRELKVNFGDHESVKSPSQYARQIVKQVKEKVTRKVGLDITNTTRSSDSKQLQRRDEILLQLKSKNAKVVEETAKLKASPKPKASQQQPLKQQQQKSLQTSIPKRRPKPVHDIGFSPRLKNQEEGFVSSSTATRAISNNHNIPADKKCKKTQLLSSNNVPTLLPIKKDPSPPATKIPPKQAQQVSSDAQQSKRRWSQLSSSTSQTYKQQQQVSPPSHVLATRGIHFNGDMPNGGTTRATTAAGGAELRQYVTRILGRTGIDKDTPVSFTNWFSPSHPLDPSIFYHLEDFIVTTGQLGHRCNKKLLFHLVDEILVEILRPYINMKPWVTTSSNYADYYGMRFNGSQLINMVCYKIQRFPCADCQVLEDIDALIDNDLPESKVQNAMAAFEEEGEGIVREVEKDILDTLIHETAMVLWF